MNEKLTPTSLAGLRVVPAGEQDPSFNALIFGEYGVGKTRLAGSAAMVPELSDVLMIDIEGGALTLRKTYPQCKTVRVSSWKKLQEVYDEIATGAWPGVRTVILDSLTEAQLFNMDDVMRDLVLSNPDRDEDIAGLQEWQKNGKQIRKFIRLFRDLPMTTIFTALLKEEKDKMTGKRYKRPSLPGKLAAQVPAMFDEVFFLYVKNDEEGNPIRCLLTGTIEEIAAKDRSGQLPLIMTEPTMAQIYNRMFGEEAA